MRLMPLKGTLNEMILNEDELNEDDAGFADDKDCS